MSIYVNQDGVIKKGYINFYNRPVFFGYYNDGSGMKKFYDFAEAVDKVVIYVKYIFRDTSTAKISNANQVKVADLSGYGSLTVGNNYIQVVSNRNNSSIWCMVGAEIIFKSYDGGYGFYPLESFASENRFFDTNILKYVLSVTGYMFYRSNTSQTSYGYGVCSCFGVDIPNMAASTSSTVTKTFNENNNMPYEYSFAYIGAGRESGSQNITAKLTFNSISFNGVSIPIVVENRVG